MRKILVLLLTGVLLTPAFASALTITRNLSLGSRGSDVSALQEFLIASKFLTVSATGYFGLMTKTAVANFQKANGLEAVGSVGPKTRALLSTITMSTGPVPNDPTHTPPVVPPTSTSSAVAPTPTPSVAAPAPTSTTTAAPETTTLIVTVVTPSIFPRDTLAADLSVTTNRNAYCRYASNPDTTFSSMNTFTNTGAKNHTKTFTALGNGNLYVYYVKCEDAVTFMTTSDVMVSFSIANTVSGTFVPVATLAAAAHAASLTELKAMLEKAAIALNTMQ